MDRRMYRGNMRRDYRDRRVSPYQPKSPVCGDIVDRVSPGRDDRRCDKDKRDKRIPCFDDNQKDFPVGMCYVPWQRFQNLFDNEFEALANGTLFKDLDLKWYGRGCK